jgi:hypothetical protein
MSIEAIRPYRAIEPSQAGTKQFRKVSSHHLARLQGNTVELAPRNARRFLFER